MSNLPVASLIFRTSDLPVNSDTEIGSCDVHNTNFTYKNINLRTVLGDMYDKYDRFNLCLNSISSGLGSNTFGVDLGDRSVNINIAGLPFINSTYDATTKRNSYHTHLGSFTFVRSACPYFNYNNSNMVSFGKNQELVNLNIFYERIAPKSGSYAINTVSALPDAIFTFYIFGIPKEEYKNGSRITF